MLLDYGLGGLLTPVPVPTDRDRVAALSAVVAHDESRWLTSAEAHHPFAAIEHLKCGDFCEGDDLYASTVL